MCANEVSDVAFVIHWTPFAYWHAAMPSVQLLAASRVIMAGAVVEIFHVTPFSYNFF